jgi:hypothetical protein
MRFAEAFPRIPLSSRRRPGGQPPRRGGPASASSAVFRCRRAPRRSSGADPPRARAIADPIAASSRSRSSRARDDRSALARGRRRPYAQGLAQANLALQYGVSASELLQVSLILAPVRAPNLSDGQDTTAGSPDSAGATVPEGSDVSLVDRARRLQLHGWVRCWFSRAKQQRRQGRCRVCSSSEAGPRSRPATHSFRPLMRASCGVPVVVP